MDQLPNLNACQRNTEQISTKRRLLHSYPLTVLCTVYSVFWELSVPPETTFDTDGGTAGQAWSGVRSNPTRPGQPQTPSAAVSAASRRPQSLNSPPRSQSRPTLVATLSPTPCKPANQQAPKPALLQEPLLDAARCSPPEPFSRTCRAAVALPLLQKGQPCPIAGRVADRQYGEHTQ
jgi:hypothetical protein